MLDSLPERLKNKIEVCPKRGCWLWNGEINRNGYGRLWYNGHRYMTHIFMHQWKTGKDTSDKYHDHICENRRCCNPEHIDPTTQSINCKRKFRRRVYVTDTGEIIRPRSKNCEVTA